MGKDIAKVEGWVGVTGRVSVPEHVIVRVAGRIGVKGMRKVKAVHPQLKYLTDS